MHSLQTQVQSSVIEIHVLNSYCLYKCILSTTDSIAAPLHKNQWCEEDEEEEEQDEEEQEQDEEESAVRSSSHGWQ